MGGRIRIFLEGQGGEKASGSRTWRGGAGLPPPAEDTVSFPGRGAGTCAPRAACFVAMEMPVTSHRSGPQDLPSSPRDDHSGHKMNMPFRR